MIDLCCMNKKEMVSIKISEDKVKDIMAFYLPYQIDNNGDYIKFFALKDETRITLYESKKGYKLFLDGENALKEALRWDEKAQKMKPKIKEKEKWLSSNDQIGSDEVGVGDLFLPLIVVAAYVSKDDIDFLKSIGVHDSKKINDSTILEIAPLLINRISFSKLTLQNSKYNEMILKGENLNTLKAKMHNQALLNMKNKHPQVEEIYIDQFVKEETYYKYLKNDKEILRGIIFKTKGESSFFSVAVASIIARYAFLKEKELLEEKYGMTFPFGSGKQADLFIEEFLKKYDKEELKKVSKMNFANLKDII